MKKVVSLLLIVLCLAAMTGCSSAGVAREPGATLNSAVLHFLATLPEEAATSDKSVEFILSSNDQKFTYKVR